MCDDRIISLLTQPLASGRHAIFFFSMKYAYGMLDYAALESFIRKQMKMTHIYQPLMIRTILESDSGSATVDDIARVFVGQDRSYLEYYKKIVKRWPHDTLVRKRKVAQYDRKSRLYSLQLDGSLSVKQKEKLIELCNLRLDEFIGNDNWIMGRRITAGRATLGSSRYDILAKSKGVCVACGTPARETQLDIDHIVPIACGGHDTLDNMQALCYACNRQKRDRDETDFLLWHKQLQFAKNPKCRLCDGRYRTNLHNRMAFAATEKNCFVAPVRHVSSFSEMIPSERQLCMTLVDHVKDKLRTAYPNAVFDLLGLNDDSDMEHCRIRIVPRRR